MGLPCRGVRPRFGGCSCGICICRIHSQYVAAERSVAMSHIRLTNNLVGGPLLQVRILVDPECHSFPCDRTLHMTVLTQFLRLWHNQGSVAPLDDVSLENGRSLRFRLRVGPPMSNIWNTLVPSHLFVLVRFPFFSDVCTVLQSSTTHVLRKLLYLVPDHLQSIGLFVGRKFNLR